MANLPSIYKSGSGNIGWPDYSREIVSSTNEYTAPEDGFFWCFVERNGLVRVNGRDVFYQGEANQSSTGLIPVKAGDVIYCSNYHDSGIHFFPCR